MGRERGNRLEEKDEGEKWSLILTKSDMKKNGRLWLNHLKRSRAEIISQLKSAKSVAPQSIENRFIRPLDFYCLSDFSVDWESIQRLSGFLLLLWFANRLRINSTDLWCCSDFWIDWESIQLSSDLCNISDFLIDWESIRLLSGFLLFLWFLDRLRIDSVLLCVTSKFLID